MRRLIIGLLTLITSSIAQAYVLQPSPAEVKQALTHLTVPFIPNEGQAHKDIAFYAKTTSAGTLAITQQGRLLYALPNKAKQGHAVLQEKFVKGNAKPRAGKAALTKVSSFTGQDRSRWASNLTTYETVGLGEVWPGIEVDLHAKGGQIEKYITVKPKANPRQKQIEVKGAKQLRLKDERLVMQTSPGEVSLSQPIAWQEIEGERRPVHVAYQHHRNRYGFKLGAYDPEHAVIIDPIINATYLGGDRIDIIMAIDHGVELTLGLPLIYVTGDTRSVGLTNFPGLPVPPFQRARNGPYDAFVAALTWDLDYVFAITYLGGSSDERAYDLAVDGDDVYIAGSTDSKNFPGVNGGAQDMYRGGLRNAFVAKMNSSLTQLVQASYFGGTRWEEAFSIALADDAVFLGGIAFSDNLPGLSGASYQDTTRGGSSYDGFLARFNRALTVVRATYLGGSGADRLTKLAIDPDSGDVFAYGSTEGNFPAPTAVHKTRYLELRMFLLPD